MRTSALLFVSLGIFLAILAAGCAQLSQNGTPTPTPTILPGSPGPNLSPSPTDVVPEYYYVAIEASRNTLSFNPTIRVTFRGGAGMNFVNNLDVMVIRSDGIGESASFSRPLHVGDFVELKGTTGKDRVIVTMQMINGKSYKIYDNVLEFRVN
jgi:hypothetical protein